MAQLNLFLIRHGESVDNVASVYAGIRDSPLTAHGVLQARRLGSHLVNLSKETGRISYIFASDLQRAARTAGAIQDAAHGAGGVVPDVVLVPEIRERDFGSDEGKKFGQEASADWEPRSAMNQRVSRFVETHLVPIMSATATATEENAQSVMIIAHGIILGVLYRLLQNHALFSQDHISSHDRHQAWRNTGYHHLAVSPFQESSTVGPGFQGSSGPPLRSTGQVPRLQLSIEARNCVDHLSGLKKTRGGIGSAQFDDKQKSIASFFTAGPNTQADPSSSKGDYHGELPN